MVLRWLDDATLFWASAAGPSCLLLAPIHTPFFIHWGKCKCTSRLVPRHPYHSYRLRHLRRPSSHRVSSVEVEQCSVSCRSRSCA
ncbi:hypothetical protein B0H34DRAFT_714824 [Crassisporium funariophilum]|nr:hypothetical protein B0H34DRAFT_714824 [Crassisporium funariophilum]